MNPASRPTVVIFQCPTCSKSIEYKSGPHAASINCPHCGRALTTPALAIGRGSVIGGFRIENVLGCGAMGQVYVATQLSMDRTVALKILPPAITGDEHLVRRFLYEVRLLAKVEHPHIVTAFEAGEQDGVYFLAMSYVDGETMAERLKRELCIPEREALRVAREVASAMDYVWTHHRILHNDLKPGNIMIDRQGVVKVMDLGLSKCVAEDPGLSLTGVTIGTPLYISPEMIRGGAEADARSDQYALGATLFHLITGTPPHRGESVAEILTKRVLGPVPSVREANAEVSEACDRMIRVTMAKEPADRFPDWNAVIAAIDDVLAGRSRAERADGAAPRKNRVGLAVAAASVAILLVGLFLARPWSGRPVSPAPPAGGLEETPAPAGSLSAEPPESLQVYYRRFPLSEPSPAPAAEERLQGALAELEKANPGQKEFQAFYRIKDGLISLDLSGNAGLADIRPLSGLPLKEIRLHETGVRDISPLRGMPLESLGLNSTPLADISVTATLPLKELTLWRCAELRDLSPLAGHSTLARIILPPHHEDIGFLKDLPALQRLSTAPDGWQQTADRFWAAYDAKQSASP